MKERTKCPNGHVVPSPEQGQPPECSICELIGTHYSTRTGEVYSWMAIDEYREANRNLQDQMDAAFDNQYFSEW